MLEESVKSSELESKASRETALRLVEELDHERRRATSSAAALDSVKVVLGLKSSKYLRHLWSTFMVYMYKMNKQRVHTGSRMC